MPNRRSAFFVSDRTGITAESLGHSLLTQFAELDFKRDTVPFIDTPDKAHELTLRIIETAKQDHHRPLVFLSIVDPAVRKAIDVDHCAKVIDFFETFLTPLEQELGHQAVRSVGKSHGIGNEETYHHRIDAVLCLAVWITFLLSLQPSASWPAGRRGSR